MGMMSGIKGCGSNDDADNWSWEYLMIRNMIICPQGMADFLKHRMRQSRNIQVANT